MAEVDLHLHTTYSDGILTPTELVDLCARRGLRVISVTDHDSTEGLAEALDAARAHPELSIIPGVEMSTDVSRSELHLLGYFVDYHDSEFQDQMRQLRDGRHDRGRQMVDRLRELGVMISWERVQELSDGGAIGRPHIAQAMVEQGYVEYPRDAFDKYIGRNGLAYVGRVSLTAIDAVKMLVRAGGLPVMAHPSFFVAGYADADVAELKELLGSLKDAGLVGIEVHYKNHTEDELSLFSGIATELDLVECGGTDYHGWGNPDEVEPGAAGPPLETVGALKSLLRDRIAARQG